ncbi:hypothetical protein D1007_21270 [Hordeum vulgare]|nr:hypothetical protein D1007_21270 [Hordeum vulgare]
MVETMLTTWYEPPVTATPTCELPAAVMWRSETSSTRLGEAAEAEAARNRPPPVPQLRTQAEQMAFLVSTIQGMEKNIQEIMQNPKSLERVVETKFHNMDMKVTELTTIARQLQHEVDSVDIPRSEDEHEDDDDEDESLHPTTTQ